jgi:hypothetical protein
MTDRKRSNLFSVSSFTRNLKKKGGGGRLIGSSRDYQVIRNAFLSGTDDIFADLVNIVSKKACEFTMQFTNPLSGNEYYHGQGGFLRGTMLAVRLDGPSEPKRFRVAFQDDLNYKTTPLTAKHNLKNDGEETYLRTTVKCFDQVEKYIALFDGGCAMTENIQVCPATATIREITWSADDISFGDTITDPSNVLTKASRLFERIPTTFKLRVGHKIEMLGSLRLT